MGTSGGADSSSARLRRRRFAFAIPFKPRSACADWEQAQANLRRTVRFIRSAAGSEAAVVVVACHEEPDLGDVGGDDVHLLSVPFAEPADQWEAARDKARKRRFIGSWLRQALVADEAYVMFFDADDLVHRDTLEYVLAHGHGSYVVDHGYFLDLTAGLLWHRREAFHRTCGSSFVCRFARGELTLTWEDVASPFAQFGTPPDQRGHEDYDAVAAELGRPPVILPFPAVVYTVNHSESLSQIEFGGRRGCSSPRDFVWPASARRILGEEFGAPDLARRIAGAGRVSIAVARVAGARARARTRVEERSEKRERDGRLQCPKHF